MPSVKVSLPKHVVIEKRGGETYRVYFRVRHNVPEGWPSQILLPIDEPRTGNLSDTRELDRIRDDVEGEGGLLDQLRAARGQAEITAGPGSLPAIADAWKEQWDKDKPPLRPRTRQFYEKTLKILVAWSKTRRHPPLRLMALPKIIEFLDTYADRPAQMSALRSTLSALFSFALKKGLVKTHPFGVTPRMKKTRKRKINVIPWTQEIVDTYAEKAKARKWIGGAIMLHLMWETSADSTDVITWLKSDNFVDGPMPAVKFARGKTGRDAIIPISTKLAEMIRDNGQLFFVTDLRGEVYKPDDPKEDQRRTAHLRMLRAQVVAEGGPYRVFDHIRHSAATDAIDKGATFEQTKFLTQHSATDMLESVYVQMTLAQATIVQKARGIV